MNSQPARETSATNSGRESQSAEYYYHQGVKASKKQELEKEIAAFQKAIVFQPDLAVAYCNLGGLLARKGEVEAAIDSLQKAIQLQPNLTEAYCNLGIIQSQSGQISTEAIESFQKAIALDPALVEAHYNLGNIFFEQGKREAAIASYQKAVDADPNYHPAKLALVISQLPVIYSSEAEIAVQRDRYAQQLASLAQHYENASEEVMSAAAQAVGSNQPFYLTYQGQCDRQLQSRYGSLIQQLMASRYPQWNKPLAIPRLESDQKIRIGFASGFFNHHSVWKILLQGWVENLDRSEFELFGYFTGSQRDEQTVRAAKAFDRFEHDFLTVEQWAAKIAEDDLHVLIYPEFGMDTVAVQLGCLRLAPVQIASWGHPETSGLPTIDYFLSSDLMESSKGESHYSEQLVRLPNLGVCYRLIDIPPETVTRKDIGLEVNDIMFWCCQSLYKYLPQHDDIFPRIAKELVNAKFAFIQLTSELSTDIFRQRLADAFQKFNLDYRDYCLFLPRLSHSAYAGTTALADVYLDNLEWSGGNTTLESTAYNLPIVTLPGALMRGRHSTAILKMMGVEETIAQDKNDYIQIAVRLGKDANYRQQIARKIAEGKHKCYGDLEPVRALENFLLEVVNKPRRSNSAEVRSAFQLAEEYYQSQQIEAAQHQYLQVLALQPEHTEALYSLATIEQQKGELAKAEGYLLASVKAQPNFLKSWFSLGNLRQSQGQFETAEAAYRQAIALRPDSVAICNNLGYTLQQQEKWSEAADYYQQALNIMPTCREAEVNLGNALFSQAKLDSEQQAYYAELNYRLGLGRDRAGDGTTAEIYYRQAILMQPESVEANYQLGLLLQQQRKLEAAIDCYQRVLQLNEEFGEVYYSLGQVYQDLGDLPQATENFRQGMLLMNPDYAKAVALAENAPPLSIANCETPAPISGTVTVGVYEYPAIPVVAESKRPFWSVVIPVVNRPEFFPECLACVLSQWTGTEDMEIIVLDNGSSPPQSEIPDRLGRGIIRYCRLPETIPLQENWNTAISLCRGQWIHLLHNDDYVLPEFYARLKASLETCPDSVGAAFTAHHSITEDRQFLHEQDHGLGNYRGIVRGWIEEIGYVNSTSPPSMLIKRTAYEKLGGYRSDILFTCDWELYKRNASFYDWWYEPGILAHYRRQSNSVTVAENLTGRSGFDHLMAIEISESYLPSEKCAEITAKSRINHFLWCLDRAKVPLKSGNLKGTSNLLLAAIKIQGSPGAVAQLKQWLEADLAMPMVEQLAQQPENSGDREQDILTRLSREIFYNL